MGPLATESIDSSNGVMYIFYDSDTNVIYLAGKVSYSDFHLQPVYLMPIQCVVVRFYQTNDNEVNADDLEKSNVLFVKIV